MSDAIFVTETPAALALVDAVRADDQDTIRDILTARDDSQLWALVLNLAALVDADQPDPERILRYCCSVETRLTYSDQPETWPIEDLQDALCVWHARTADPTTRWVARGIAEHRRRRTERQAALDALNAQALAARGGKEPPRRLLVVAG